MPPLQTGRMTGVLGSFLGGLIASPMAALLAKSRDDLTKQDSPNVWLDERPEQIEMYPSVCVMQRGSASLYEETFEGFKIKDFRLQVEIYARSLDECERIAREFERTFENPLFVQRIALAVGAQRTDDDAGVEIQDDGESYGRERKRYSPEGQRPYVCNWPVTVRVKYLSTPARQLPE